MKPEHQQVAIADIQSIYGSLKGCHLFLLHDPVGRHFSRRHNALHAVFSVFFPSGQRPLLVTSKLVYRPVPRHTEQPRAHAARRVNRANPPSQLHKALLHNIFRQPRVSQHTPDIGKNNFAMPFKEPIKRLHLAALQSLDEIGLGLFRIQFFTHDDYVTIPLVIGIFLFSSPRLDAIRLTLCCKRGDTTMDELLKILKTNALESPQNLAKMLKTSVKTIKARIAKYEKTGVIRGYQAIVNEDQLELGRVYAAIEVKITPEREGGFNHVATRISKFPEVESLYLMSGGYDLLVFVKGKTLKDVAFFVSEKLATIAGVISTSTHFKLKTYKEQGVLMEVEKGHERLQVSP